MKLSKLTLMSFILGVGILYFAHLIDKLYGIGTYNTFFNYFAALALILILGSFFIFPLILIPILRKILGREAPEFASPDRVVIWLELARLFHFDECTDDELLGIAQELFRIGATRRQIKKIIATEIAPVCVPRVLSADFNDLDTDDWTTDKEWLTHEILSGRKAFRFAHSLPLFGWIWYFYMKLIYRKQLNPILNELKRLSAKGSNQKIQRV